MSGCRSRSRWPKADGPSTCIDVSAERGATHPRRRLLHLRRAVARSSPSSSPTASCSATTDPASIADCDDVVLCVPTPLSRNREPDLSYVMDATRTVGRYLRRGHLVVLESTTYPGTTRDELGPMLEEASGLVAGVDFHLAMSPERIDPGRIDHTIRTTPKVVGGLTPACTERACALYAPAVDTLVPVTSPEAAELTKLLENIFRSVNIALVNELAMLCDRLELDVWEVLDAAATKPFGFMPFKPGPGLGGHCLPLDPFYLAWKAREVDFQTEFIELAGKVNANMPYFCMQKIARALNRSRAEPARLARAAARRRVQARHRRHARVAGAEADRAPARRGRRRRLPRPARARAAVAQPRVGRADDAEIARAQCVVIVTDHIVGRLRARRRARADRRRLPQRDPARARLRGQGDPPVTRAAAARRRRARLLGAEPRAQPRAGRRARVGVRSLRGEPRALRARSIPRRASRPSSTRCSPTTPSTPSRSRPPCRPTTRSGCACSRPASTCSSRSRWRSRPPRRASWSRPPRPPTAG